MRARIRTMALVITPVLCLTACGSETSDTPSDASEDTTSDNAANGEQPDDWDAVLEAAREEGVVRMYTAMLPGTIENVIEGFSEKYPDIAIEIDRIVGSEIDSILEAERDTGAEGADIVSHVNYSWARDNIDDLAAPVGPNPTGDEWADSAYQIDGKLQLDHFTVLGVAWNTDLVDDPPATYEDLLREEFAGGRIGIPEPLTPAIADNYAFLEDTYGDDFLTQFAAQDPQIYSTAVPIQEALITGEISVTMFGTSSLAWPARDEGAPIDFLVPDPGWAPPGMTYLLSWAENPNAAQVLYDYLASPEGQEVLSQDSIVPMEVSNPIVSIDQVTPLDVQRVTEPDWLTDFFERWEGLFR